MYDFEGRPADRSGGGTADRAAPSGHQAPPLALTALELPRWVGAWTTSRVLDLVPPVRPRGGGRPVLVLPGFAADDLLTGRLRGHLRRQGFRTHGWGLGRNIGLTDALVEGLTACFEGLVEQHDEPVSVVGWSFGGLLARRLAHEHPDHVRQVICLGSPWRAEGERTRATAMFERSRAKHGLSPRARDIVDRLREPVPVPLTAVWSRSDGVVPWQGCRVEERTDPPAENVEVVSSHAGLVANPLVLAAVVDRLSQDPAAWQPFSWRGVVAASVPGLAS